MKKTLKNKREVLGLQDFLFSGQEIALVGAGPSLDLWYWQLQQLKEKALFFIVDIVASGFFKKFGIPKHCLVFSVEKKRHLYLQNLSKNIPLAVYSGINWRNIPQENPVYVFSLVGEKSPFLALVSPGTVMGLAFAYSLYLFQKQGGGILHSFGLDYCFKDFQVYSRLVHYKSLNTNRYQTFEQQELFRYYRRGDVFFTKNGLILRTSREFWQSRKNLEKLLETVNFPLKIFNYSSWGFSFPFVQQMNPF